MNKATCIKCGWVYTDSGGMGIHRPPIECPNCGGKVIIKSQRTGEEPV